jgi:hypothetical protein
MRNIATYLLIDTALFESAHPVHSLKAKESIKWLKPLYARPELVVSPVVIDVAEALRSNRIDLMMHIANRGQHDLGVSVIDTELTLEDVVTHLKKFIYFVDQSGVEFTLRIADCAVLSALSQSLLPGQWSSLLAPFVRWRIHDREGRLQDLPPATTLNHAQLPLDLNESQIDQLLVLAEPDRLLANLQIMRPDLLSGWTAHDAHQAATEVIEVWNRSNNQDHTTLLLFARAAFVTRLRLLRQHDVLDYLRGADQLEIRQAIQCRLEELTGAVNSFRSCHAK